MYREEKLKVDERAFGLMKEECSEFLIHSYLIEKSIKVRMKGCPLIRRKSGSQRAMGGEGLLK